MAFERRVITGSLDVANLGRHNANFADIEAELDEHETRVTGVEGGLTQHKASATAHAAQNITYSGAVPDVSNVKQAIDSVKAELTQAIIEGDSGPEAATARASVSGTTYATLGERLNAEYGGVTAQLADSVNYDSNDNILGVPADYLKIPSTLADSLATHPSVVNFGASPWNGYRYWMAFTPYPGLENENPCIAVSNDNVNWVAPAGVTNPLAPWPGGTGYNSDTEMIYIPETSKLRMYYRTYGVNANVQIYFIESANGVVWSAPTLTLDTPSLALSPAIVRVSQNDYRMWYINNSTTIMYRTSVDGVSWSAETLITQFWQKWSAWHFGITIDSTGKYHMLASSYPTDDVDGVQFRPIIYALSTNGVDWTPNETPQIIPSGWASGYLYRPHFEVDTTRGLKDGFPYVSVYFGASNPLGNWNIGYSEGFIQNHENETLSNSNRQRKGISEAFTGLFAKVKIGVAYVTSVIADKVTIKNAYTQPNIVFEDKRKASPNGNKARIEWSADATDANNRLRFLFSKNGESLTNFFQMAPFGGFVGFASGTPGNLLNIKNIGAGGKEFRIAAQDSAGVSKDIAIWDAAENAWKFNNVGLQALSDIRSARVIVYNDGARFYEQNNTAVFHSVVTSSSGNLMFRHSSQSTNFHQMRADGNLQALDVGYMDAKFLSLAKQTSQPAILTSARPGIYLADGTTHDPCGVAIGKPYLVYYDGTYTKIS